MSATRPLPAQEGAKWKPLAAGLTDGKLLLVMSKQELAVVTQKAFAAGTEITKVPLGVLAHLAAGEELFIVTKAERAILNATEELNVAELGLMRGDLEDRDPAVVRLAEAILAHREAVNAAGAGEATRT